MEWGPELLILDQMQGLLGRSKAQVMSSKCSLVCEAHFEENSLLMVTVPGCTSRMVKNGTSTASVA
jgi:hypothetical protein